MEKERSYEQAMIELIEELQSFKYSLFTWKEDLEKYRKQVAEFSKMFIKLSEITESQLQEQNKIFEDKWVKLVATVGYVDSKVEKIYTFMENRLVNLITELLTALNETNDGLVKIGEISEKFVEGQNKTVALLGDVKKLLTEQLEIRKKADLEAKKVRKKIEQKLGE